MLRITNRDLGIPPLREIVSCSGSNVEGIGKIVDYYTRPVDERATSYIKDTPHILRMFHNLNIEGPQSDDVWLFVMDVINMYPSIPTSRGPEVLKQALSKAGLGPALVDWLVWATRASLTCNTFEYDNQLYTQREGAAIGGPASCSYSGVFLEHAEAKGLKKFSELVESSEEGGR